MEVAIALLLEDAAELCEHPLQDEIEGIEAGEMYVCRERKIWFSIYIPEVLLPWLPMEDEECHGEQSGTGIGTGIDAAESA